MTGLCGSPSLTSNYPGDYSSPLPAVSTVDTSARILTTGASRSAVPGSLSSLRPVSLLALFQYRVLMPHAHTIRMLAEPRYATQLSCLVLSGPVARKRVAYAELCTCLLRIAVRTCLRPSVRLLLRYDYLPGSDEVPLILVGTALAGKSLPTEVAGRGPAT